MSAYQPKTGQRCGCKRGIERDNCGNCEGTGWQIDFKAIRERKLVSGVQPDPAVASLVSAAAEAQDRFGDDELERFADELRQKGNTP